MWKFYILDWSSYIFRAYHAFPEMLDWNWNNINAVYWFFKMLFKLFNQKPNYFVVVRDSKVKTIRHENYKDYKANRPKASDDLKRQIQILKDLVNNLNLNYLEIPRYEADDIIGTLISKSNNLNNYIISSDKDLKQLISKNTFFYDTMKNLIIKEKDFKKEYNFDPVNMLDYLTLLWDASDNIPWLEWVWKKIASNLIQKYSTIDNIYNNLNNLTPILKDKFETNKNIIYKNMDLIKLYNVPNFEFVLNEYKFDIDFDLWKEILVDNYWFNSIEKNLKNLEDEYKKWEQLSLF